LCGCRNSRNDIPTNDENAYQALLALAARHIAAKDSSGFEKAMITKVEVGTDADLRAALILCIGGGENTGQYDDTIVALLKVSGDEKFCHVLSSLPNESRGAVASVLAGLQWGVDDDDSFQRAKLHPDYHFPRTWRLVFETLR
jgi:hypothetical protein